MSKLTISIEGYIANELSIRDVSGHRVLDVSVPHTPSKLVDGKWEDAGSTEWFRATFWDEHADAVLISVQKGSLVTLTGGLKSSTYEKKQGGIGITLEVTFPVLAVVVKRPKKGDAGRGVGAQEPWAAAPPAAESAGDVWNTPSDYTDGTPF